MTLARVDDSQGFSRVLRAMAHVEMVFPDDTAGHENDDRVPREIECGEELAVEWTASHAITPGTTITPDEAHQGYASSWVLRCGRGHVLAVSDGQEFAEAFDPARVLGI